MKRKFLLFMLLLVLASCFAPKNDNSSQGEEKSEPEKELIIYYKDNENINKYLNSFNANNKDMIISSDMVNKYHHHGKDHDNQVKVSTYETYYDGWDIQIDSVTLFGNSVRVLIYKNKMKEKDEWKEVFFLFLKGYGNILNEDELETYWNDVWENTTHSVKYDDLEIDMQENNGNIQNIIIKGKISQ